MKSKMVLNNEDMSTVLESLREQTDGNKCGIDEPSKWKLIIQKAPQVLHLLSKQELKMLGGYLVKEMVTGFQIQPKVVDVESDRDAVKHFVHSPELEDFGIVFSSMIQNIADDVFMLSGKHKILRKLVIEILNGSGQYKCPPSSLEIGFQVLSSLPLVALSDKDREDLSYVCISVLKTFPNLNAKKGEATLNADLLRNWCLLLATVLDLSHETDGANIFSNIPPNLYFDWLVDGFPLDFDEEMNQTFVTLIEKSCFALFIDKDVLLKSESFEFINQLAQSMKLTKSKNIAEKRKCDILKFLLQHLICHWKSSADGVIFEETLSSVRNTVNQHLRKQSKNSEYDLNVEFLQVVATILNFECQEDARFESPNPNLEYLLNNILWTLENRQIDKQHLEFIESVLSEYQHFSVQLGKSMVKQIWNLLLTNVTSKTSAEDMEVEESDADVERRILNICINPNPSQIQNGVSKITHETFDLGPGVCKIFVRLFEFLDSEDLQSIFHEILEHLLKMYDTKQLLVFLNFWNEFLPMLFETKVKEFLPNTFCAILFSCNQIVEGLKEHTNSEGVRTIILMVFSTIKSILSYNSILQDSNLAFLCLNTCQLVASGMVAPFEFIMPVFKEICDVLFSFITNYENQAKNMLPTVLGINNMLVDVIFMYGYEGSSMDTHQLSQIENCANLMTRLFMNYSKKKESLSKIAMYLIGDYCCRSLRVTLHPRIKKEMLEGVYILMDICDEHRFKQLKRTLPSDVQFLFVKLLQEYQKYYKYQGKF